MTFFDLILPLFSPAREPRAGYLFFIPLSHSEMPATYSLTREFQVLTLFFGHTSGSFSWVAVLLFFPESALEYNSGFFFFLFRAQFFSLLLIAGKA